MPHKSWLLSPIVFIASIAFLSCTEWERDNPLDPGGTAYKGISQSSSSSADPSSSSQALSSSALASSSAAGSSSSLSSSSSTLVSSSSGSSSSRSSSSVAAQSSSSRTSSSSSGATSSSSLASASSSSVSSSSSSIPSSSSISSSSAAFPCVGNSFAYQGVTYGCKTIGSYTWMTENLKVATSLGYYCENGSLWDCATNGPLYNWATALQVDQGYLTKFAPTVAAQGICPAGWRIPGMTEWENLNTALGSAAAWRITSWSSGTDAFSVAPTGYWDYASASYTNQGSEAYFWANDQYADLSPILYHKAYSVKLTATAVTIAPNYKSFGFSVRCVTGP